MKFTEIVKTETVVVTEKEIVSKKFVEAFGDRLLRWCFFSLESYKNEPQRTRFINNLEGYFKETLES